MTQDNDQPTFNPVPKPKRVRKPSQRSSTFKVTTVAGEPNPPMALNIVPVSKRVRSSAKAAVAKGLADILNGSATADAVLADVAVQAVINPVSEVPASVAETNRAKREAGIEAARAALAAMTPEQRRANGAAGGAKRAATMTREDWQALAAKGAAARAAKKAAAAK